MNYDVVLVCMPFAPITMPSLALSILKQDLVNHGCSCVVDYENLYFSSKCDFQDTDLRKKLRFITNVEEFVFSSLTGYDSEYSSEQYIEELQRILRENMAEDEQREILHSLKELVRLSTAFLEEATERILQFHPKIVACTSTLFQNNASFALLKKIKERDTSIVTIMGGANCSEISGLAMVRQYEQLDYVFSGEGEIGLAELCKLIINNRKDLTEELPFGVLCRRNMTELEEIIPYRVLTDMNLSPCPDFDDFFDTLKQINQDNAITPGLVYECSRGCWWASKKPCNFCGLNGAHRNYREKSVNKIMEEILYLSEKYGIRNFEMTDNILGISHMKQLLPELEKLEKDYTFFWEVKTNMKREELISLKNAGIKWIQAGIESLQDNCLKYMNKGNRGIKHVEFLKNCKELNIRVMWNILYDIPGDQPSWYQEIADLLPKLTHLIPPASVAKVVYNRFSEYFNHPEKYDLILKPDEIYHYFYPAQQNCSENLAYNFYNAAEKKNLQQENIIQGINKFIEQWREAFYSYQRERLDIRDRGEYLDIIDLRKCNKKRYYHLRGLEKEIYLYCMQSQTKKMVMEYFEKYQTDLISKIITFFIESNLMIEMNEEFLSLGLLPISGRYPHISEAPGGCVHNSAV